MKDFKIFQTHSGFTLIELMIIVTIIGILAATAISAYRTYTQKAAFAEVIFATTTYILAFEVAAQVLAFEVAAQAARFSSLNRRKYWHKWNSCCFKSNWCSFASVEMTNSVLTIGTAEVGSYTYILTPNGITAPIQWDTSET